MKRIALLSLVLLAGAASAGAQTLSPIVDGHVRRTQTVHYDPANPSNQFCSRPNNCVATFVYIDKIYVGGQNAYADPDPSVPVLYWEDSRAVFEFDISAVPASAAATLNFTTVDNFYPPAPDTPLAVTVYRLSAADSNGVLTNCDFNAAGGGYDSKRWITAGCSNLVQQPSAGGLSLDTVTFPKSWSLDVTSALAAAKGAGQTRLGLAIAGNQGADPATDTNFDGDELRVAHSTEASGPTLVVSALAPGISLSDISCPGTTPGTPVSIPVTIRSVGSGPLTITGVSLRADSDTCHAFTLDTTGMQTTIPSGGQTTFDITFSPTVAGTCSVLLVVTSNDPDTPTVEREVSCTATTGPTAKISVTPASNSCGPIPVGSTTSTTITVSNTGSATLTLSGVTELADPASAFSATAAGLPASLAPGASAGFVVTFAPTAAGTFSAAYQVESNATNPAGGRVDFSCSASACTSGGGPAVSVVPGSGSCQPTPVGGSSSTLVTIRNVGGSPLSITGVTEVQDAGGAFHAVTDGLQATLNCGQQTSFRVVFAPPAAGDYSALFRVATDDPAQPTVDVPFSCSTTTPTVETADVAALAAAASGAARWVAAGAKTTGSGGTFWVTDMEIENTSDEDSTFRVVFLEAGHANSSAPSASFRLAPGATLSIADVLGAGLFGKSATSGAILVAPVSPADTALIVSSRTYNLVASGTFGQFIGGVGPESRLLTGGKQLLVGLAGDDGDFRTNVGAVNTSSTSATIRIVLRKGSDGAVIGSPVVRTIDPFGQLQVNRIFTVAAAGTVDNAFAEISLDSGSGVVAYASVIDNRSGDPICIPAAN